MCLEKVAFIRIHVARSILLLVRILFVKSRLIQQNAHQRQDQEQPLVEPQVSHLRQVPLRTMVKLPHSAQLSPS